MSEAAGESLYSLYQKGMSLLESGDFAIIGIDITVAAKLKLPPTAGCGPDEKIVFIPRNLLVAAKRDIPEQV